MSGPTRYQPSRRSRFRAHDQGNLPPVEATPADPAAVDDPAALAPDETDPAAPLAGDAESGPESRPVDSYTSQGYTPSHADPAVEPLVDPTSSITPLETVDELPRAFQLRYDGTAAPRRGLPIFYTVFGSLILLSLGLTAGYLLGARGTVARTIVMPGTAALPGKPVEPAELSADLQGAVDAAFSATKEHRYADATKMFAALHDQHPEWPSMAVESARATLYEMDAQATGAILNALMRYGPSPDGEFMRALLHLTHKEFDAADRSFAAAVALDPARADFYYFWGECLRDQGKPREAAEKFRAALLRNQYETSEDLYQLKLWLSQIQADQEESSGANAKINEALSTPRPPYSAFFAAAAREVKAGRFKEAAAYLSQAQQTHGARGFSRRPPGPDVHPGKLAGGTCEILPLEHFSFACNNAPLRSG